MPFTRWWGDAHLHGIAWASVFFPCLGSIMMRSPTLRHTALRRFGVAAAALPLLAAGLVDSVAGSSGASAPTTRHYGDEPLVRTFKDLDRTTAWELTDRIALDFPTYHPQGFALVGNRIFMSTVEIIRPTVAYPEPQGGYDRTPGKGVGHVLVLTRAGDLLRDIELGRGHMYHPGGIDFDGHDVWVPVAQYRPDSRAVVYTIDPRTYQVRERFTYDDHVGGVVRDAVTGDVHGVSWGSRRMFQWGGGGRLKDVSANRSHLLDYQDCSYVDRGKQICSGITGLPTADGGSYELGGLALLRLRNNGILHEVPFPYFSTADHVATRNPVALEIDGDTVRLLAAPDDGEEGAGTELLIYEAPR
ncbi:DUF6454 family protein [soil metagenome]